MLLLFVVLSIHSFCQTNNNLVANKITVALRQPDHKLYWFDDTQEVNIKINLEKDKVTINSDIAQVYNFISLETKDSEYNKWYCVDKDGKNCYLYLMNFKDNPNITYVAAEYDDVAWYYSCKH